MTMAVLCNTHNIFLRDQTLSVHHRQEIYLTGKERPVVKRNKPSGAPLQTNRKKRWTNMF